MTSHHYIDRHQQTPTPIPCEHPGCIEHTVKYGRLCQTHSEEEEMAPRKRIEDMKQAITDMRIAFMVNDAVSFTLAHEKAEQLIKQIEIDREESTHVSD